MSDNEFETIISKPTPKKEYATVNERKPVVRSKAVDPEDNLNQIVKQQKNGWWYVTVKRSESKPKDEYTVTAIVLRALYVENSSDDVCYDAYLYNVTPSITRDRTEGTPNKSIQKLLECLD